MRVDSRKWWPVRGGKTPPIHGSGVLKVEDFRMISVIYRLPGQNCHWDPHMLCSPVGRNVSPEFLQWLWWTWHQGWWGTTAQILICINYHTFMNLDTFQGNHIIPVHDTHIYIYELYTHVSNDIACSCIYFAACTFLFYLFWKRSLATLITNCSMGSSTRWDSLVCYLPRLQAYFGDTW